MRIPLTDATVLLITTGLLSSCRSGPPASTLIVPGTVGNRQLQKDVRNHLWNLESRAHDEDCEFEVVKAELYGPYEFSIVGRGSDAARQLEKKLRANGQLHVERWTVSCCGSLVQYEVLLMDSVRGGGTDIAARRLNWKTRGSSGTGN